MANLKTKQQHVEWARVGGGPCEQRTCLLGICMNYIGVVDRSTSRASGCFCFGKLLERDNFVYWLCCQWSMWRLKLLTLNSTFTWLLVPLCSEKFFKQTASTKLRLKWFCLMKRGRAELWMISPKLKSYQIVTVKTWNEHHTILDLRTYCKI